MAENERLGRGADRRGPRAEEAERHLADVEARLGKEVARSLEGLRSYDTRPKVSVEGALPQVEVVDEEYVAAIVERGQGYASRCDLAVLDCASFVSPGGGYERGNWGQEQALCAGSTLFPVLREQGSWYAQNRGRNINCELYTNRALVVPAVYFERDRYHGYADVIVVAPPNARRARERYRIDDDTLRKFMRNRIRFLLAIADDLGHEKLMLSAFGCGAFGWDAAEVAELFRAELARGRHVAREVTIVVPRSRFEDTYERFEHAFAAFPERNDAPYVKPEERPRVEEKRDEDEDDEDDWRQYL